MTTARRAVKITHRADASAVQRTPASKQQDNATVKPSVVHRVTNNEAGVRRAVVTPASRRARPGSTR